MTAKYWIKVDTRLLDNPKIGMLPDRPYLRIIQLSLLANKYHEDGHSTGELPSISKMAYDLRMSVDDLRTDLRNLMNLGFVELRPGGETPTEFTMDELLTFDFDNYGYVLHPPKEIELYPAIWQNRRLQILERDNWICQYCGKPAEHVDHITPRCQGGTDKRSNLVAACASCNLSKGGRTPAQAGMEFIHE